MKRIKKHQIIGKHDTIHRRALRAAAAATMTIAPGCGGGQKASKAEPVPTADKPTAVAPAPSEEQEPGAAAASAAASPTDAKAVEPAPAPLARMATDAPDCSASEGMGSKCCSDALTWCRGKHPGEDKVARSKQRTCQFSVPGCMPWGPPAPPRYKANLSPVYRFELPEMA